MIEQIRRCARPRRLGGMLVAGVLLGAGYLLSLAAAAALCAHPRPSDVIVVLGNALAPDGRPSARLRARLDAALETYRRGFAPLILVSGGVELRGHRDEARAMAEYLEANGAPTAVVVQDCEGVDTWATARHTVALVHGRGRVLVVSQWFHLPRAVLAMRRFGLSRVSGSAPSYVEFRDLYSFLREAAALPFYAFRPVQVDDFAAPARTTKPSTELQVAAQRA